MNIFKSFQEAASLLLTVYVEDENDHSPQFMNGPYEVSIDELTPVGLPILNGIVAVDGDKPNTPNSDVTYSIVAGNEHGLFALQASQTASLVLAGPLDYDRGPKKHVLRLKAQVYELYKDRLSIHCYIMFTDI